MYKKTLKEKVIGATGSVSGAASALGSWQVCHNICLAIIALLAIMGITITGMPLLFLTKIAIPIWIIAVILFIIILSIYIKKKCMSKNLIVLNSGFIIAGIPFQPLQKFSVIFLIAGGLLIVTAIFLFVKEKIQKKKRARCEKHA